MAATDSNDVTSSQNNQTSGGNLDPLFISNSDNPTASLVAVQFSGQNFIRWSRSVKRALIAKNKDGFITGSVKKPDVTDKDFQKWKRADYMVVSWILSSMSADIADDFSYIESSVELWSELQERFGQSNGPLVYQLKKEIDALKQENMTIIAYYGKIKKLWDELQSLRAFPKLADLDGEDRLMQFLLGLNSGFDSTITNILSMDPLPTINRAFSIAQQIEKQKEVSGYGEMIPESSAMAAQRMMRNGGQQRYNQGSMVQGGYNAGRRDWKKEKLDKKCDHCKGKGHTIDQCFKLIGYPEWYNAVKASKALVNQYGGNRMAANVSQEHADSPFDLNNNVVNSGAVDSQMMIAICQEVMRSMKGKQVASESNVSFANFAGTESCSLSCVVHNVGDNILWIIDSGACDHMVYDVNLLVNKRMLDRPIRVVLPDGSFKYVKLVGSVCLNENLILHDVMLVEGFKHNLMSIGRLIDQTGVRVVFTRSGCLFQDLSSEAVIGQGKRQNGLYYFAKRSTNFLESEGNNFVGSSSTLSVENNGLVVALPNKTDTSDVSRNKEISLDLLHARLGHVSLSKMKHIGVCEDNNKNSVASPLDIHLSQFMHNPRAPHLRAALHVLRYLKGSMDSGLWYTSDIDLNLKAYSDADWSGCQFSSRSLSAYTIFLGSNLVSWKTKKQRSMSHSSAESEYRSMTVTTCELVCKNPMFHDKTKHLKRDMHYVRKQVEEGFIKTVHVSSKHQLADLLTKPLVSHQHQNLCSKLGLLSTYPA
uniref:Retrotransposon Copia-like N-terminal domain-containing protein n=1 Tax=Chenopodium quinoa TaxID=63459 RepID=A0A803LQR9_CHEQI